MDTKRRNGPVNRQRLVAVVPSHMSRMSSVRPQLLKQPCDPNRATVLQLLTEQEHHCAAGTRGSPQSARITAGEGLKSSPMFLKICQAEVCGVSYLYSINDSRSVQPDTFNFLLKTHKRQSQPFFFLDIVYLLDYSAHI